MASLLACIPLATTAADAPDLNYGLYLQFGLQTFNKPGVKGQIPAARFAPSTPLNLRAWAHAAKEAGMTFAVLPVKHETGFCLWASRSSEYNISQSPYKRNLIDDFIAACQTENILPALHYSIPDGYNEGSINYKGPVSPQYYEVIKQQITEIHTSYPEI